MEEEPTQVSNEVNTTPTATPEALPPVVSNDPATTPSVTPQAVTPVVATTKKRHIWPFVVAGIVLLLAAGAAAYLYKTSTDKAKTSNTPATSTTQPSTKTAATTPTIDAAAVVKDITPLLKNPLVSIKNTNSLGSATGQDDRVAYSAPYLKPNGYEFMTNAKTFTGVASQGPQATADTDLSAIKAYLDSKGFKHDDIDRTDYPDYVYSGTYYNDTVRCTLEEFHISIPYQTDIGCADVASYTETAKLIQPLYEVYKAAGRPVSNLQFSSPVSKESKTSGYQIETISTGLGEAGSGSAALFYQTPDGTWHYFTNAQQAPICSKYNTTDLKNAYLGETCYDSSTGGELTVKL